ncbi:MAG: dihydrolipoamide acetyltransferase family protein [Schleiferiaceae bacterium]|nr:dihydrolipoamide acetyltransferase family protein [Schleiferiaceae bacterium]
MFELIMPKMGESVAEATITQWLKKEGETISMDESVLTIATDKVDSDIPSPVSGVLVKCLFQENEVIQVGQVIAHIQTEGDAQADAAPAPKPAETPAIKEASPAAVVLSAPEVMTSASAAEAISVTAEAVKNSTGAIPRESEGRFYSPLVRSIAEAEGVSEGELSTIHGSGSDGRVTKSDLLQFIKHRSQAPAASSPASMGTPVPAANVQTASPSLANGHGFQAPKPTIFPGDELVEMDRMRSLISDHMVMSKHVSPHVTSFVEADVTNLVLWRNKVKSSYEKREDDKLTFTPIFMEAVIKAIKDFPNINVSIDGKTIVKHKPINLGMATALPSGNLIVPVIKNADRFSLSGLAKAVNELAEKARTNKLAPDDIQGGTYTVTNVGTFGNVMGTPIINQPQVAILALGAIRKLPAVLETPSGDVIAIRHKMFLSHSYDHRVVDGALGGMFVRRVADYLEQWDLNREI